MPQNRLRLPNRSEEHTSELQSRLHLVCRLLLEKKKNMRAPAAGIDGLVGVSGLPTEPDVGGSSDPVERVEPTGLAVGMHVVDRLPGGRSCRASHALLI